MLSRDVFAKHSWMRQTAVAVVFAGLLSVFVPAAKSAEWDPRTTVTFSAPVEVPGMVLPAGTYVFQLEDNPGFLNVLRIYNQDATRLVTTVMTVNGYRERPSGKALFTLEERSGGTPQALHTFFEPGKNYGHVFVYDQSPIAGD
jgi:hypothetical protein